MNNFMKKRNNKTFANSSLYKFVALINSVPNRRIALSVQVIELTSLPLLIIRLIFICAYTSREKQRANNRERKVRRRCISHADPARQSAVLSACS